MLDQMAKKNIIIIIVVVVAVVNFILLLLLMMLLSFTSGREKLLYIPVPINSSNDNTLFTLRNNLTFCQ